MCAGEVSQRLKYLPENWCSNFIVRKTPEQWMPTDHPLLACHILVAAGAEISASWGQEEWTCDGMLVPGIAKSTVLTHGVWSYLLFSWANPGMVWSFTKYVQFICRLFCAKLVLYGEFLTGLQWTWDAVDEPEAASWELLVILPAKAICWFRSSHFFKGLWNEFGIWCY